MIDSSARSLARRTTAVILAAGLGSRLGATTRELPKCLVPVAGEAMLGRMLDSLRELGIQSVTIAVGHRDDAIREFIEHDRALLEADVSVRLVKNERYATTGSACSLDLALDAAHERRSVLLIEADVVADPALIADLLQTARAQDGAATLLAPYEPCLSGTFASVEGGVVTAWLHESVRRPDFDIACAHKTVYLTFVPQGPARQRLAAEVKGILERFGPKAPLEYAMQALVAGGMRIAAVPTRGLKWFEVDTPDDLAIANRLFGGDDRA